MVTKYLSRLLAEMRSSNSYDLKSKREEPERYSVLSPEPGTYPGCRDKIDEELNDQLDQARKTGRPL